MARLRLANLMAPCHRPLYAGVAAACGAELVDVADWRRLAGDEFAGGFVCSPPVVWLGGAVEPVAAPVLDDGRFGGRPLHASEVMVPAGSPGSSVDDLRGRRWAVNEPSSWSGYWVALRRVGDWSFFGEVVEAGSHERALRLLARGDVDGAAIDCHVLARQRAIDPDLVSALRVIETLSPTPTQPLVLRSSLPDGVRAAIRETVLGLPPVPEHSVLGWVPAPDYGLVRDFVANRAPAAGAVTGVKLSGAPAPGLA